jgi:hypothetical protein
MPELTVVNYDINATLWMPPTPEGGSSGIYLCQAKEYAPYLVEGELIKLAHASTLEREHGSRITIEITTVRKVL